MLIVGKKNLYALGSTDGFHRKLISNDPALTSQGPGIGEGSRQAWLSYASKYLTTHLEAPMKAFQLTTFSTKSNGK